MVAVADNRRGTGQTHVVSSPAAWSTERWTAAIVIVALAILIALRLGFRGVAFSARVSV